MHTHTHGVEGHSSSAPLSIEPGCEAQGDGGNVNGFLDTWKKNFSVVLASQRRRDGKRSCRMRRRSLGGRGRKRAQDVQQRCEAARDVEGCVPGGAWLKMDVYPRQ